MVIDLLLFIFLRGLLSWPLDHVFMKLDTVARPWNNSLRPIDAYMRWQIETLIERRQAIFWTHAGI